MFLFIVNGGIQSGTPELYAQDAVFDKIVELFFLREAFAGFAHGQRRIIAANKLDAADAPVYFNGIYALRDK